MSKTVAAAVSLAIPLDDESNVPLFRQLYESVRESILSGALAPGVRLPATRTVAADLGVSRNTVLLAFEQLRAEGYIEGKVGSGSYVSRNLPDQRVLVPSARLTRPASARAAKVSRRARQMMRVPLNASWVRHDARPFQPGLEALDAFPFKLWARLLARHCRRSPVQLLSYGDPAGYRPLREAIAAYLSSARGVRCSPDQVLLTGGTQRAVGLVAQALLDEGDEVWVEDPGYLSARGTFLSAGIRLVPVPVDSQGLDVAAGVKQSPKAQLAFVTPSHQDPLGITMSLSRRLALLEWARRAGSWILEDDWGSEFRYVGRPLPALQALDRTGRVIYSGTFAQKVFPGLRLGYLIVPTQLVEVFAAVRALIDLLPVSIDQAALTDFIAQGHFARHLRRMRTLYAERQAALVKAVEKELNGMLEVRPADAGIHLVGWLPPKMDDVAAAKRAALYGIATIPLSAYSMRPPKRGGLLLGYGAIPAAEIRRGTRALAQALCT